MKTLENHTIIFDHECPLCKLYTGAFISTGMLDKNGRVAFDQLDQVNFKGLDVDRAKNEIALVNKEDQTVTYGVESLMKIIAHRFAIYKPLFALRAFRYVINQVYFFISYNRKEIAPGKTFEAQGSCIPKLNVNYRLAYLIFTWLLTSIILFNYSKLLVPMVQASEMTRELIICGGQILFQGVIVYFIHRDRYLHYLGNLMTISVGGAMLLLPMLILSNWINNPLLFIGYFLTVVVLMFLEHIRRVKILELPWYLSLTWVIYRLLVLAVLFQFMS